jgi:CHAT domain-containing protein/Tfp pilus assembly protein PilF
MRAIKLIISGVFTLGVCLTPFTVPLIVQPSWKQSQSSQEEIQQLFQQAVQKQQQGQPLQAIATLQQILAIARQLKAREIEATALLGIGFNYSNIGRKPEALDLYNRALAIFRQVNYPAGEAATLNKIGLVYESIRQSEKALNYYNQALPIWREVNHRSGEAASLNNIGSVYRYNGQWEKALKYSKLALPITQEVNDRAGEATTLSNIGTVYANIGQPQEALKYFNQALPIMGEVNNHSGEAATLNNIGSVYLDKRQTKEALKYYNQALLIWRKVKDPVGKATTLSNIGQVYGENKQLEKALNYYNLALPIIRKVNDRTGEATILNNVGAVYKDGDIKQQQEALNYLKQALLIRLEVNDRAGEAFTLSNIGAVYQAIGQPTQAISNLERSIAIILEMRGGLKKENRQKFLQNNEGRAIALISLLIDQNQPEKAFEWANLATTADLADYTRLINARVSNPQLQQLIDQWKQRNEQIQFLYRQNDSKPSDQLSQQINALQEQNNKLAEEIRQFPEGAELFETKPTDIKLLRESIPEGTVVIQPILLTNVKNVPNTVAIFILTKDQLSVIKKPIDPKEFDELVTSYRQQLQGLGDRDKEIAIKLYDILIRPVEDKIKAFSPKQLSIIATGKLRYIPFETLYDQQTGEYLIQKYPINYLTRLSSRSLKSNNVVESFDVTSIQNQTSLQNQTFLQKGIFALGNPIPQDPQNLPGTEEEVKNLAQMFPGSQVFLHNDATLEKFKIAASRFPILHLATHGCFQPQGCKKLNMEANTILFADQQFKIADAALLGLQNTQLLTLSACQTAIETNSNGEEIAGVAYIFERAGAKSIIATLWSVDDATTKDLMIQFYQNMKQGMSKSEALRKAKISLINRHPYYWSPFILIGNGR